ncbi:hypothetical protein MKZ38_009353 [Zalerion maritima]|uniref:Uncharacterized protein n=1 Tax=Zalerion maritima TaxID=339359 RepID=A0AAD5RU91_9PEZI|nr:hypothetical protein MKZ38_009353 [Zalerion maritima]
MSIYSEHWKNAHLLSKKTKDIHKISEEHYTKVTKVTHKFHRRPQEEKLQRIRAALLPDEFHTDENLPCSLPPICNSSPWPPPLPSSRVASQIQGPQNCSTRHMPLRCPRQVKNEGTAGGRASRGLASSLRIFLDAMQSDGYIPPSPALTSCPPQQTNSDVPSADFQPPSSTPFFEFEHLPPSCTTHSRDHGESLASYGPTLLPAGSPGPPSSS